MTSHYKGTDAFHDITGYRSDEIYTLSDGRIVTKKSWDAPLIGWEFMGAVFLESTRGLVDNEGIFTIDPMGYRVHASTCSFSYTKADDTAMTQEEFDEVVERLRQEGHAVENFQLVDGLFWLNHVVENNVAPTQQEEPVEPTREELPPAQPEENA